MKRGEVICVSICSVFTALHAHEFHVIRKGERHQVTRHDTLDGPSFSSDTEPASTKIILIGKFDEMMIKAIGSQGAIFKWTQLGEQDEIFTSVTCHRTPLGDGSSKFTIAVIPG